MTFTTTTDKNLTLLRIEGELDALSVADLRPTLDKLVAEGHRSVVVDLSALRMIDSSGVGSIVSLYKRIRAAGGQVVVRGAREQPLAILKLLRIDKVLMP